MSNGFNPDRLSLARRRRGLTKVQLAQAIGVSTRILIAYERGEKEPGPLNRAKLAAHLDFPDEFFSGTNLEEPPLDGASFRALSNLTSRHRDQALGSAAIALSVAKWIDDRFSLPESNVPQLRGADPETAAAAVRREWGLGERPIRNTIHLLEANGVRVFSLVEECRELDAFSFWFGQTPYVFLNTMKSAEHSRMDTAHELGHLVLHWREGTRRREAEREADLFASAFLMPRGSILAEAPRGGRLADIIEAKKVWNVSAAALTYRMHKLGLLSGWQYRTLFVEISGSGFRRNEPDGSPPESSQALAKVFESLHAEGIPRRQVAAELNIKPEELDKMIFGLVITSLPGSQVAQENVNREKTNLRLL
jgi:Zn-dependent peptidase ImmA (M78 family)/DNA-binding XRE family transcriptional regulator